MFGVREDPGKLMLRSDFLACFVCQPLQPPIQELCFWCIRMSDRAMRSAHFILGNLVGFPGKQLRKLQNTEKKFHKNEKCGDVVFGLFLHIFLINL